jgi:hypothetical protein
MAERSKLMIHDAHGLAMGNARDMRSMADLLDALSDTIADIYAERSKGTRDQWRAAMQAAEGGPDGTWYDAKAAVKAKLADEVVGGGEGDGKPGNSAPAVEVINEAWSTDHRIDAQWDAGAFLQTLDEVANPAPPVEIPTGRALFAGLFDR